VKRVIVTGASGFIGRFAIGCLQERGFEVHTLSRRAVPKVDGVYAHQVNLLEVDDFEPLLGEIRASHLLHLAWCARPPDYWTSSENFRWVRSSLGLLEGFRKSGGRRVVGAGTCAEYDWSFGYCVEGQTPTDPQSIYGVAKDCAHRLQSAFCRTTGLSGAWGRIFFLYGPGEDSSRLVPTIISGLLRGAAVPCTLGTQYRDYLYVADVASALAALLDSDVKGSVNIASGRPISVKELVGTVATIIGGKELIRWGALESHPHEPALLVASVERLATEVGWRPVFDIHDGISATVAWWNRHYK